MSLSVDAESQDESRSWRRLRRVDTTNSSSSSVVIGSRKDVTRGRESDDRVHVKDGQQQEEGKEAEDAEAECSICLGRLSDAAQLDCCSHSFCFVCIYRWCTDICNACPLCKKRVRQIRHWGDGAPHRRDGRTGQDDSERGSQEERKDGSSSGSEAKEEKQASSRDEEESGESVAAAWGEIQLQRASNQRHRRHRAALMQQLSLDSSPASLSDSLHALHAIAQEQAARVTRGMVRQQQEEAFRLARADSASSSRSSQPAPASPTQLSSPARSLSSAASSLTSSASSSVSPAGMLVVEIADRAQRAAYPEDLPSPSILNISCLLCHSDGDESLLLLCDGCDDAYHTYCLSPPLQDIPPDEWFCPQCEMDELEARDEHEAVEHSLAAQQQSRGRQQATPSPRRRAPSTPRRRSFPPSASRAASGAAADAAEQVRAIRSSGRLERLRERNRARERREQEELLMRRAEREMQTEQARRAPLQGSMEAVNTARGSSGGGRVTASSSASPAVRSALPSSSLSRLPFGAEAGLPTLAARMREMQLAKQREREAEKEREQALWRDRGMVESLLDAAVRSRETEREETAQLGGPAVRRRRRELRHEPDDEWTEAELRPRVRRKIPRKQPPTAIHTAGDVNGRVTRSTSQRSSPPASVQSSPLLSASPAAVSWSSMLPSPALSPAFTSSSSTGRSSALPSRSSISSLPVSSLLSLPSSSRNGSHSDRPAAAAVPPFVAPRSTSRTLASALSSVASPAVPASTQQQRASSAAARASPIPTASPASASSPSSPRLSGIRSFDEFMQQQSTHRRSRSPFHSPPSPLAPRLPKRHQQHSHGSRQHSRSTTAEAKEEGGRPPSPFLQ